MVENGKRKEVFDQSWRRDTNMAILIQKGNADNLYKEDNYSIIDSQSSEKKGNSSFSKFEKISESNKAKFQEHGG